MLVRVPHKSFKKRRGADMNGTSTTFSREKLAKGLSGNGKRRVQRFQVAQEMKFRIGSRG
jgi:hypothetical protein